MLLLKLLVCLCTCLGVASPCPSPPEVVQIANWVRPVWAFTQTESPEVATLLSTHQNRHPTPLGTGYHHSTPPPPLHTQVPSLLESSIYSRAPVDLPVIVTATPPHRPPPSMAEVCHTLPMSHCIDQGILHPATVASPILKLCPP